MLSDSWKWLALNPEVAQDLWKLSTVESYKPTIQSLMPTSAILISNLDSNEDSKSRLYVFLSNLKKTMSATKFLAVIMFIY